MAPQGSKYSCKLQNEDEVLRGQCAGLCTVASVEWPLKSICAKKMCAKEIPSFPSLLLGSYEGHMR